MRGKAVCKTYQNQVETKKATSLPSRHRAQIFQDQDNATESELPQPPSQVDPHCLLHLGNWKKTIFFSDK